jgi:hypothetical protein
VSGCICRFSRRPFERRPEVRGGRFFGNLDDDAAISMRAEILKSNKYLEKILFHVTNSGIKLPSSMLIFSNVASIERTREMEPNNKELNMFEEISNRKANLGFVWVKAVDSGTTYLCPASSAGKLGSASDAELSLIGVNESLNPHND